VHGSRRLFTGLIVAGALAIACHAPAAADEPTSSGSVGVRIVDVPLLAADDPRARLYIVDHAAPGTRFERQIEVSTTSTIPTPVALYPAAASIEDGRFTGAPGRTANSVSQWTTVEPRSLDIPAGGSMTATVVIDIPADATEGEQYGVIWAQTRSSTDPSTGVAQTNRVGIRIYLSIGPGGSPATDFEINALAAGRATNGNPIVLATVTNTGGRALDLLGSLTLRNGPGGLTAGPFPVNVAVTLGIGEVEGVRVHLDPQLPAGPWTAELTLSSGLVERTASATLTFPDSGMTEAIPAQQSGNTLLIAALLLIVALLLSLVGTLTWFLINRSRAIQTK
jgi:hypothetical protein